MEIGNKKGLLFSGNMLLKAREGDITVPIPGHNSTVCESLKLGTGTTAIAYLEIYLVFMFSCTDSDFCCFLI